MVKIVFISDNHIGLRFDYHINVNTGISERSMDFIKAVQNSVEYSIANDVKIFVIAGDFYENVLVGPTYRELTRNLIFKPLIENNIHLVVLGGNHDTPMSFEKGSPLGELSLLKNSLVARKPGIHKIEIGNEVIGFVLLPYLAQQHSIQYIEKIMNKEIPRSDWLNFVQEFLANFVEKYLQELDDCNTKFLVGHYYFRGSKIRKSKSPQYIKGEIEMTEKILMPDSFDLCILGHIHLHQHFHNRKIVIPGATERVDFGELDDPKGFIVYDTEIKDWEFIENNPRLMLKYIVHLNVEDIILANPTQMLLDKITGDTENALIRIEVISSETVKNRLNYSKIEQKLKNAFHYEIFWKSSEDDTNKPILSNFTLDPQSLFNEYVEDTQFIKKHPNYSEIKNKGRQIISDILNRGGE
ncbi:MAG: Nuclease SbcCD subunit D [Candidatus Heimdallarchaeota archaeon LC_3]|nr:MAG: Nuclease SbcCD subunit D [Candidatus Heimdallarchaeota archaeon LC_3]